MFTNRFEYTGIDPLDEALRDRFHYIEVGYLPPSQEAELITMRTGLPEKQSNRLVEFANSLRFDGQDPIHVSTRRMLMIAELVQAKLPMRTAIVNSIGSDKDKLESILLKFDFGGQMAELGGKNAKTGDREYILL